MKLAKQEIYQLDGREFRSLKDTKEHVENEIGKILDATPLRMDAKQVLAVFEAIVTHKERLVALLSIEVDNDDPFAGNILDLDL